MLEKRGSIYHTEDFRKAYETSAKNFMARKIEESKAIITNITNLTRILND